MYGSITSSIEREVIKMITALGVLFALLASTVVVVFTGIWWILTLVSGWMVFKKYGEPGWKALIPIYNGYVEYGKVWNGIIGIVVGILSCVQVKLNGLEDKPGFVLAIIGILLLVAKIKFASNKAKAFGKGTGFAVLIFFLPFVANFIIGFDSSIEYLGNPEK